MPASKIKKQGLAHGDELEYCPSGAKGASLCTEPHPARRCLRPNCLRRPVAQRVATASTDIYGALLELGTAVREALVGVDDELLGIDSLWEEVAWHFETYDDDRDAHLRELSRVTFTPVWKESYIFEFLSSQPLSRQQAMRVNQVLNRFGLEIAASRVSQDEIEVYLGEHPTQSDTVPSVPPAMPPNMRDRYLGDTCVWRQFHGWMRFQRLDECTGLNAAFAIAYRFTDDRAEEWTVRFNLLKNHQAHAISRAEDVMASAVSDLVQELLLDRSQTVIVPCLTSSETTSSPTGVLSSIARRCSEEARVGFVNDAISKRRHNPLQAIQSARERQQTIASAEYAARRIDAANVLLIDDFITRGDTMSAVASAIREASDVASVYGIALGKNERLDFLKRYGYSASNGHVPNRWLAKWPLA